MSNPLLKYSKRSTIPSGKLVDPNNVAGGAKKNAGVSGSQANKQQQVDPKFLPRNQAKKGSMVVEASQPNDDDDSTVLGGNSSAGEEENEDEVAFNEQRDTMRLVYECCFLLKSLNN
jgi:hypothetical protein